MEGSLISLLGISCPYERINFRFPSLQTLLLITAFWHVLWLKKFISTHTEKKTSSFPAWLERAETQRPAASISTQVISLPCFINEVAAASNVVCLILKERARTRAREEGRKEGGRKAGGQGGGEEVGRGSEGEKLPWFFMARTNCPQYAFKKKPLLANTIKSLG